MSITLESFSAGDISYVLKFNNNFTTIQTAINALQTGGTGTGTTAAALDELWKASGTIGASAFSYILVSDTHLQVGSGSVWFLAQQSRARSTSATNLAFTGLASGTYYVNVDTGGGLSVSTAQQGAAIYSVYYSAPSFASATRLLPILLDGEDYARLLSSAPLGSFARVADRLSSIEALATLDAFYGQSGTSGAQWHYKAGQVRNNHVIFSAVGSFVSLLATSSLYVEVDPTTGSVSVASGGFTSGLIPLRYLKTSGGVLVSNEDRRTWATMAVSGGGGGVAGLTISGSTNPRWTVATSVVSAQSAVNGGFQVYRGGDVTNSSPEVRWNEGLDRWEFTNDSASYVALGGLEGLNLGAGRQTRLVMVTSGPVVLNEPGRSATSLAEISTLTLSAYVSTTTLAALLRGYMLDSAPGSSLAGGSTAGILFYKDSATLTGEAAAKVVAVASASLRYDGLWVPVSNQACAYVVETASICSVRFALVAYVDTVQGVGTQLVSGTRTGIGISAGVGSHMKLSSTLFAAAALRTLVHYLETSGSMGASSLYDVEFYGSLSGAQSQLTSALLFQATNIDASAAYLTRLPWMHVDADSLTQMYLRLSNNGTTSGSFSVVVRGEQYA